MVLVDMKGLWFARDAFIHMAEVWLLQHFVVELQPPIYYSRGSLSQNSDEQKGLRFGGPLKSERSLYSLPASSYEAFTLRVLLSLSFVMCNFDISFFSELNGGEHGKTISKYGICVRRDWLGELNDAQAQSKGGINPLVDRKLRTSIKLQVVESASKLLQIRFDFRLIIRAFCSWDDSLIAIPTPRRRIHFRICNTLPSRIYAGWMVCASECGTL